jgi:small subunit ribosomal protein S16
VLTIRLRRMGSRQDPYYRVVVSESTSTPKGRFLETLGTYDPGQDPAQIRLDLAKVDGWIEKGAQTSETVRSLIDRARRVQA